MFILIPVLNNRYGSVYSEPSPTDLFINVHFKPAAQTHPATLDGETSHSTRTH